MCAMSMMSDRGYTYTVSDEQLRTFASMSLSRRLQWLEEMREFTYRLAPPACSRTLEEAPRVTPR